MYCNKCGNKVEDGMMFCNKCGHKIGEDVLKTNNIKNAKIKVNIADVVNKKSVLNSTNKVAYIANAWALKIKNRGITLGTIVGIIFFIIAISSASSVSYYSGESSAGVFFSTAGMGLLYAVIIIAVFNTTAFIIRMGAEIIQLLDDIKKK